MKWLVAWGRTLTSWAREELRLVRLDSWEDEFPSRTGSVADPRVARMDLRQRAMGKRMRRDGRHLLAGKPYHPETVGPMIPTRPALKSLKTIRLRDAA